MEKVLAVELQDSAEHIFERLVFSDGNDIIYEDNAYKEQHRDYYIRDIHEDIVYTRRCFKKIENKYFINNHPVDQVVEDLFVMVKDLSAN